MIINATDLKNNLGKYLREAMKEDIIITSSGRKVAKLSAYEEAENNAYGEGLVMEPSEAYQLVPRKVTYEEFLEISKNSDERYEYIDGEIYLMASPKTVHQQVLSEMHYIFAGWFRGKKCRPMLAPYDITLKRNKDNINVVQPDLMVICDLEENLNEKDYYMGVPTLVVEILSESTRGKDAVKKLDLYMSTGVMEYWLVNPFSKEVTVYNFENNDFTGSITYRSGEIAVSSTFDGLQVAVKSIFS
jgi:prevent-host-death family protein